MTDSSQNIAIGAPASRSKEALRAFFDIDEICRRSPHPTGQQLLLRAYCLLILGDAESGRRDLRSAVAVDSADLEILAAALDIEPSPSVARSIIGHPWSGEALVDRAAAFLLRSHPVVIQAKRTMSGLDATILRRPGLQIFATLDGSAIDLDRAAWRRTRGVDRLSIRASLPPNASARIELRGDLDVLAVPLAPAAMAMNRPSSREGAVSVIVPIYGGREATRACLAALAEQRCRKTLDVVLVDDACPDADMVSECAALAAREGWRLVRHALNLGFAAAVNAGATIARGDHLLLLNADAILPQGGIDRLLSAAAEQGVGTVVPFSNDGSFTSFPIMRISNPVPKAEEAERIDAAARRLGPKAVDIPAGTAFCMLVTGPCWDVLGGLDLGYGRGYFEDIDLCLRARRRGFRNVLAPQVYVRHVGSQSFGAAKRALVAENARLLVERFPDYDEAWLAFVEGDPLGPFRGAIERQLPPTGPVRLVVGQAAWALPGAGEGSGAGPRTLVLREEADGSLLLRAEDDGLPQSLRFGPDEASALSRYLDRLDLRAVTLADPSDAILGVLEGSVVWTAPLDLALVGRRSLRLLQDRHDLLRLARIDALDGMGRAVLGLSFEALPPGVPEASGPPRVAALVPRPALALHRLLFALDRGLSPRGGEVVIFGEAVGRRARPRATGRIGASDYAAALRHRGMTHLLLADADAPFRLIEDLRRGCTLPAAYVDWSGGRHRAAPGDLALDDRLAEPDRVEALVSWCTSPASSAAGFA